MKNVDGLLPPATDANPTAGRTIQTIALLPACVGFHESLTMIEAGFSTKFDWDDVKLFLQIARVGTLTGAAAVLGLSQSTASRRLKALESAVTRPLFQREGTRYRLTDEGEMMFPHAERMEEEALALGRRLMGADHEIGGIVKVTSSDWFSHHVLAAPIARFTLANPSVTVEIVADPRHLDLRRHEADLALRFAPFSDASIVQRRFAEVRYGLYASEAYLDRCGSPDASGDGDGQQLIMLDSALDAASDVAWLYELLPRARLAFRSNNRDSQAAACVQGAGIAVLPRVVGDQLPLRLLDGRAPPGRTVTLGIIAI